MSDQPDAEPQRPLLRIVKGDATAEEVAALVTVVAALASGGGASPPRRTPEWAIHHRKVRVDLSPGPGGWRASTLPR